MTNAQDKQWQVNKQQPFQDAAYTKSSLFSGGLQTTGDALGGLGAIFQSNQMQYNKPNGIDPSLGLPNGNGLAYNGIV